MRLVFDVLERRASPGENALFSVSLHNEEPEPVECTFLLQVEETGFDLPWYRLPESISLAGRTWNRDQIHLRLAEEGAVDPETYDLRLAARATDNAGTATLGCTLIVEGKPCARFSGSPRSTLNLDGKVPAFLALVNVGSAHIDAWSRLTSPLTRERVSGVLMLVPLADDEAKGGFS